MASILIVDDDPDSSSALVEVLRRSGHSVKHAPDAREGLGVVLDTPPDVVVLDIRMPVMSGTEFLDVVRSYRRFVALPIVLFTAHASDETREAAERAGKRRTISAPSCPGSTGTFRRREQARPQWG
jgi:CheY-like chemotaxis protein